MPMITLPFALSAAIDAFRHIRHYAAARCRHADAAAAASLITLLIRHDAAATLP